jgi:hypothetical protein
MVTTGDQVRSVAGRKMLSLVVAGLLAVLAAPAMAAARPARIFASQMVLQREMPLSVCGGAERGEHVTVRLAGDDAAAVA